jgi:putative glycosyltransferase (TIGR04348 family)
VRVLESWSGERCDLLVALHATKSHSSAARWRAERGHAPLIVGCGGTDLYVDLPAGAREVSASLELADRVVVLQPRAIEMLPGGVRHRARAILQSARPPAGASPWQAGQPPHALVLAHLRAVKDPFLAAEAARLLPEDSSVVVEHAGAALSPAGERRAREEALATPRWRWLGVLPHAVALRTLARSWVLLVTSRSEGGANVVAEAIVCGVPVLSTRIDGSLGQLGDGYPGYFPIGDAPALARLLRRCEREPGFRAELAAACASLVPRFAPEAEREAWRALLTEVVR